MNPVAFSRFIPAALLCFGLAAQAADPSSLPTGPAPVGNAAFGVTPATGKPVGDRAGFISWRTLAQVEAVPHLQGFAPKFDKSILSLDKKQVRLQGFMLPLSMGEEQYHFMLTATPPTCAFCLPGGPDSVIEVKSNKPIKFGYETVSLTGRFELLKDDPMGLYYRINEAKQID